MSDLNFDAEPGYEPQIDPSLDDYSGAASPRPGFPWKWVLIGAAILAGIGLLAAGVTLLWPKVFMPPPEKTVAAYYQALNEQDLRKASTYMDHSAGEVLTDLPVIDLLKTQFETFTGEQIGTAVKIGFEFRQLQFNTVGQDKNTATVEVNGSLDLIETNSNFFVTIPYKWTHALNYRDGKWLIKP